MLKLFEYLLIAVLLLSGCRTDQPTNPNGFKTISLKTGIIQLDAIGNVVSYIPTFCVCFEDTIPVTCIPKDSVGKIEAMIANDTNKYNADVANNRTFCADGGCRFQCKYMYCE